jgi:predicted nucleic acid-binding protein
MTVFVLDSSAVLRYIDEVKRVADRVKRCFKSMCRAAREVCISAVQWGEVAGNLRKRLGATGGSSRLGAAFCRANCSCSGSAERAVHAADIKVDQQNSYADAFALDLAMDSPDHVLVTADYDFKDVADLARIEFLPA